MNTTTKSEAQIPVICTDPSSDSGAEIFNPNSWSGFELKHFSPE